MQPGVRCQKSASLLHCTLKLFKCKDIQAMCLSANCWSLVNVTLTWSFLQRCNIRWWVIEREWNSWNKETIAWSLVLSAFCGLRKTKHTNSYLRSELCSWSKYSHSHPGNEREVRREVKRKHIWSILQTKQTHTVPGQTTSASSPISSPSSFCKLNKHITLAHKQQVPAHYHHQYFAN